MSRETSPRIRTGTQADRTTVRVFQTMACPQADGREVHIEHIVGSQICAGYGQLSC